MEGHLLLSRAKGLLSIRVDFLTEGEVREVRLVYDLKQHRHFWHIVLEDGVIPTPVEGGVTAAIDIGEIHPVAITDGEEVCILSCRELRSIAQQTNKELAHLQQLESRCTKGSRRAKRIQRAKRKLLARQKRRRRDLEHKVSRAAINWCKQHQVGTLAIGDVRDVADGTIAKNKSNRITRQKLSNWSHGTVRKYLRYKAEAEGITVDDEVPEAYTSQTCLECKQKTKCSGRIHRCSNPDCAFCFARDVVGCANLLSRKIHGELAQVKPSCVKYRHPFLTGKRSPVDTRQVANAS